MGNLAAQNFTGNASWVAPAGVTSVTVVAQFVRNNTQTILGSNFNIDPNGILWSWGDNTNGQLGLNDIVQRSSPVQVLGGLRWSSLATYVGSSFPITDSVIALDTFGRAWAWGANSSGQLGLGDVTSRSSPVLVLGGLSFVKIICSSDGAGNVGVIGLTSSGQAYGWGANPNGRLGVGGATNMSSPTLVLGSLTFTQIVMNQASTIGLSANGNTYGWGANGNGQLGNGTTAVNTTSPVVMVGGVSFAQLVQPNVMPATNNCFFALQADGTAYAWGQNTNGQLGLGDVTPRSSPVAVVGGLKFQQILSILNGGTICSTIGITPAGVAYGWGANDAGQLGQGNVTPKSSPVAVVGGLTFSKLFGDDTHSVYGLQADGTLYAWGRNSEGQLGVGNTADRSSPVQVVGGLKWQNVIARFDQNLDTSVSAITTSGLVYGWGANEQGNIGNGTSTSGFSSPVQSVGTYSMLTAPATQTTTIPVVPGTTYSVNMNQQIPMFNTTVIGNGVPSVVTLYFEE